MAGLMQPHDRAPWHSIAGGAAPYRGLRSVSYIQLPEDADGQVAKTIAVMRQYAIEGAQSLPVRSATAAVLAGIRGVSARLARLHEYVQMRMRFFYDGDAVTRLQLRPDTVEVLARPADLLRWGVGDCDDYCTLLAAMLLAAGFACAFVTIAADPITNDWSHVYVAVPIDGRWIALDASHGPAVGWEASGRRKQIWPVVGGMN